MLFLACLRRIALAGAGCFSLVAATAQVPDTAAWTQFSVRVKGENRFGYKDATGRVRIAPRFGMFTPAVRFRHIMAVNEADTRQQYYLLKNGRAVGRDSVYIADYTLDCESEGAILFRDQQKNRVGFLNAQGRVLIPALYNYATPFHNGLSIAFIGARRTCWGGSDTLHCEHPAWVGGRQVLINQRNEVLADLTAVGLRDFHPNWYSLQRNVPAPDTTTTSTLTGLTGERYTFTEYKREFRQWFYGTFVVAVRNGDPNQLAALCFSDLAVAARPFRGWPHYGRAAFVAKYRAVLQAKLGTLRRGTPGLEVLDADLNTLIFTGLAFQPFLTDCGEHFQEKYPIFDVMLSYPTQPANAPIDHQEHFEFIRTASGYRLFSVSL